jgi:hypothetical protein
MKYLKSFNESMENQIYQQVLDTIKDCFQEFEDNGWHWSIGSPDDAPRGANRTDLSYHPIPHFKYIMKEKEDEYMPYHKWDKDGIFEFTGTIDSNGEISYTDKEGTETEEFQDLIVAIKRIQEEIGLEFKFSYNNLGGDKRIIIQGKI